MNAAEEEETEPRQPEQEAAPPANDDEQQRSIADVFLDLWRAIRVGGRRLRVEELDRIAQDNPAAFLFDNNGITLLHWACQRRAPLPAIQRLYANKEALAIPTPSGQQLPLHIACWWKAPADVVDFLIDKTPSFGLSAVDSEGRTPLHLACIGNSSREDRPPMDARVVNRLADLYPQAAFTLDKDQNTPLHIVCLCRQPPLEIVQCLIRHFPAACLIRNSRARGGMFPWSYAAGGDHRSSPDEEPDELLWFLVQKTVSATCTFIYIYLHPKYSQSLSKEIRSHMATVLAPLGQRTPFEFLLENVAFLTTIFDNDHVQALIQNDAQFQNLLASLMEMNSIERLRSAAAERLESEAAGKEQPDGFELQDGNHAAALEPVADNLECIYFYVSRSPQLLLQRPRKRKRAADEEPQDERQPTHDATMVACVKTAAVVAAAAQQHVLPANTETTRDAAFSIDNRQKKRRRVSASPSPSSADRSK